MAKDYIVQKAVQWDEVIVANRKDLGFMHRFYEAQAKYDGCCALVFLSPTGRNFAQSRTGEPLLSMNAQIEALANDLRDVVSTYGALVVIAEAWWPGKGEFNKISGAFRKKSEQRPQLRFMVNDCLTWNEWSNGTDTPYRKRIARVRHIQTSDGSKWENTKFWRPGDYEAPQQLCNFLVGQGGFDGLILRDLEAGFEQGSGTQGGIIKLKQVLSFDLRVLEVNTVKGEKTGRDVYKLVVSFRGLRLGVGSGLPHDRALLPVVGQIVEVEAMDYSSDGLLREPRYKGIRHDKLEPDT